MPIRKAKGRYRFEFDRFIGTGRIRATKLLPKGWTIQQAEAYDQKETARLYASATGEKQDGTVEECVLLYITERCPLLKTGKAVEQTFVFLHPFYKGKSVQELPSIATQIRRLDVSEATKRNYIALLRAACRYAWKNHRIGLHDPAEQLVMPTVRNDRQVYQSRREMLTIAKSCRRLSRPYIRIAFYSGMRLGEIMKAVIKNGCFNLSDTKNSTPRIIPIHPKLNSALRYMPPKIAKITIQTHFVEARRKVNMDHVHFHDLRHSAASEMINAGVDLYTVGNVLGHKDSRSTQRYAHLNTASLQAAILKIGRK